MVDRTGTARRPELAVGEHQMSAKRFRAATSETVTMATLYLYSLVIDYNGLELRSGGLGRFVSHLNNRYIIASKLILPIALPRKRYA